MECLGEDEQFDYWFFSAISGDCYVQVYGTDYEASNSIASWQYYCVYICIIATNIFSKRFTTDRAIQMNPELAAMTPLLDAEYQALDNLESRLKEAGGDFNISYEVLQDEVKRKEIACILRQFSVVYSRICSIIEDFT